MSPSDPQAQHSPQGAGPSKKVVAATVAGNALEFYDFVTYAFFATYIGRTFFPAANELTSLLLSVGVFGVGFVSRPLGGVLIGTYADRVGRRPAMLLTIGLITVGTLGLALTPSYAQIGLAAPIIVVVCRLIQGLALGGEVGPSSAFLIEAAPPGRRGLFGSWQLGSQGLATLVAGLLGMYLSASLSQEELMAWGWRLPFALGLLLIPLAVYLRRAMPETQQQHAEVSNASLSDLLQHGRLILLAMLVVLGGTVATYVSNYMTTYAITTLHLPATTAMAATVMVGLMTFVFALLGGWLCDRWGRRALMIWPRVIASLAAYPAFLWMADRGDAVSLLTVTTLLAALGALSSAASLVAIPELLPGRIRALGMSVIYAVGVAIFGGSTQFVITWLIAASGNPAAPALYLCATGLLAALGMALMPEGRGRALEH